MATTPGHRYSVYREGGQWVFESCGGDDRGGADSWQEAYSEARRSALLGSPGWGVMRSPYGCKAHDLDPCPECDAQ